MSSCPQRRQQMLGTSPSPNRKELFPTRGIELFPSHHKELFPTHGKELFPEPAIELFPTHSRTSATMSYKNLSSSPTPARSVLSSPGDGDLMSFNVSPCSTKAQPSVTSSPLRSNSPISSPPRFHPLPAKPIHSAFHLPPRKYDSSPQDPFSPKKAFTNPSGSRTIRSTKVAENVRELEDDGKQRPKTTDAVARRMIGTALGINIAKKTDEMSVAFDLALKEKRTKQAAEVGRISKGRVVEAVSKTSADRMKRAIERKEEARTVRREEVADEKWRIFAQRAREAAKKGLKAAAEGREPVDSWGRLAVERGLDAVELSIESLRKECQAAERDEERQHGMGRI